MKKSLVSIFAALGLALALSGCIVAPWGGPHGGGHGYGYGPGPGHYHNGY